LAPIYGGPLTVRCVDGLEGDDRAGDATRSPAPWLGLPAIIRFDASVCAALSDIVANPNKPKLAGSTVALGAVEVASHELSHLVGEGGDDAGFESREGVTNCHALQRADQVAAALGIPNPEHFAQSMAVNFAADYPDYVPPADCVDGGPYDLDPAHVGTLFPGQLARRG
jgi:hypothetical protein